MKNLVSTLLLLCAFSALSAMDKKVDDAIFQVNLTEARIDLIVHEEEISGNTLVFGINANTNQEVTIKLTDVNGEVFAQRTFTVENGNNYRVLNLEDVPNNSYTLTIQNGSNILTRGIVLAAAE